MWFFVSDLHGDIGRYRKLLTAIADERPDVVLLGGDLLPAGMVGITSTLPMEHNFINEFLIREFTSLRDALGEHYPEVGLILGNDDPRIEEEDITRGEQRGLWSYLHNRSVNMGSREVYGYACIPPSPFLLKDWEQYDVSRHVDPGCVSPEEGYRSIDVEPHLIRYSTIQKDLERLIGNRPVDDAVILFHVPPYETKLDRAALDGRKVDHVPLNVHVGSVAVRRFIEDHQPLITLHGHVHESVTLTGKWRDRIGSTHLFSAAHDGSELALVRFDPKKPDSAVRTLL
jgi:Icc-related predicted phosphoesterase